MQMCFITFRSVTYAQRGERILEKAGIRSALQRTPRWMEEQGCGYCLRLREEDVGRSVQLLRGHEVPLRRIYCQEDRGALREMVL